jgi:hypothetical protein
VDPSSNTCGIDYIQGGRVPRQLPIDASKTECPLVDSIKIAPPSS